MDVVIESPSARRAGSVAWAVNRPYFDLGAPKGPIPLHTYNVVHASAVFTRAEPPRLGPNMLMTPVFRRLLVAETGLFEYSADRLDALPGSLRSEVWNDAVAQATNADRLADAERLALGRLLIALTLYDEAYSVLRQPPRGDPEVNGLAADLVVTALMVRYLTGTGSRRQLVADVDLAAARLPDTTAALVSALMLRAALADTPALRGRQPADELMAAAYSVSARAGARLSEVDKKRLLARVLGMHARLLTMRAPEAAKERLCEAERLFDEPAGHSPLVREARRRLVDRRCLLGRLTGDGTEVLAATEAVHLDPVCSKAWLQLGNAHANACDEEQALIAYRRAAALGPLFTGMAHHAAGTMLERLARPEEAAHEHLRAARVDPVSGSVATALDRVGRQLNDTYLIDIAAGLRRARQELHPQKVHSA